MADNTTRTEPGASSSQVLKGLAELALLSALRERAQYGLEILERLRTEAGLAIADGTIYPLLHRLERSGFVRSEWSVEADRARPRKYYKLTRAGIRELEELLAQWRRTNTGLTTFLNREMSQ